MTIDNSYHTDPDFTGEESGEESGEKQSRFSAFKPSFLGVGDFVAKHPAMRSPLIAGLLREGETANLIAAPKVGKSLLAMLLAISTTIGRPWLDTFACFKNKVLYVDNELHAETLADRARYLMKAMELTEGERADVETNLFLESLRGRLVDLVAMEARYFDKLEPGQFQLIVLDAWYRFLPRGQNENSAADITALYNILDRVADRLGCAFLLIHHTSKGNQGDKAITDVGAGSGAQTRATDTHITIREHEVEGLGVLDAVTRSWKQPESLTLKLDWPLWTASMIEPQIKATENRQEQKTKKRRKKQLAELVASLTETGEMRASVVRRSLGIPPSAFEAILADAVKDKILKVVGTERAGGHDVDVIDIVRPDEPEVSDDDSPDGDSPGVQLPLGEMYGDANDA